MKSSIVKSALVTVALLLCASLSTAADSKPATATETKAIGAAKAADGKSKEPKAAKKVKPVDINSAGKAELKTLPGIGDAEADKIIAGRPYLSKAHLVTQNILPRGIYDGLSKLVVAKQNKAAEAKLIEKQKGR